MSTTNGGQNSDLKPEDFDAIREAVMETPRGRWFLSEYANRLRASEAGSVIESMKRLEQAVSANHDRIMQRLAEALTNEPRASASLPPAVRPQPDLAPGQLKYFKQDEEIFEPAPQPKISVVAERPKKVEVPKGAKLIIRRTSEAAATVEAAPETMIAEPPATSAPELAPQTPAPPEAEATAAPEAVVSETPKVESETAAAPKSEALPQAEGSPKRRIVIIRHKPGEEIDVPLQNDMAEAS